MINVPMSLESGIFYELDGLHILPFATIELGAELTSNLIDVDCAFQLQKLTLDDNLVGLSFCSSFKIHNEGGYIWTKAPKAQNFVDYKTVIRDNRVVIYNFEAMALAISPRINPYVEAFFQEQ